MVPTRLLARTIFVAGIAFICMGASGGEPATRLAVDAYVYAYPLVIMNATHRVMTNAEKPKGTLAPMNQLVLMRAYPTASFHDVVRPNADTLYVSGWMDLGKEPMILSLPAMPNRYALFPVLNSWTNVFTSPGMRTTGTGAQTYAFTAPNWSGTLPKGIKRVASASRYVWMIGRIYCTGTPEDYAAVHKIENAIKLVPLSSYGKAYTPPIGAVDPSVVKAPPPKQVNAMDGKSFFTLFAQLLKDSPPLPDDTVMVAKLKQLGITPGHFNYAKLDSATKAAIDAAPAAGQSQIKAFAQKAGKIENGWAITRGLGDYKTNYALRALIAQVALGANLDADAMYPSTVTALTGKNKYVMHFAKGATPPVKAFWSLTMYNPQFYFYDNPLNKYTVSPRDKLKYNTDGSLDIYIQHDSPGKDREANWLPAPPDAFNMMLRMYWPKATPPTILNGSWLPPAVTGQK